MILQFKITSESFKEFEASVASDPKNRMLERLKQKVQEYFEEDQIIERIVSLPVIIGSSIDADFLLKSFSCEEDKAIFIYEFLGTSG